MVQHSRRQIVLTLYLHNENNIVFNATSQIQSASYRSVGLYVDMVHEIHLDCSAFQCMYVHQGGELVSVRECDNLFVLS